MALYLVIKQSGAQLRQTVLLATGSKSYATTKYDLELTRLKDGALLLTKVARMSVLGKAVGKGV